MTISMPGKDENNYVDILELGFSTVLIQREALRKTEIYPDRSIVSFLSKSV